MFHLCNNGKPRTEISEYNGSNIKIIDDNLLPGLSRIRNKAKAREGFPAPFRPTMPICRASNKAIFVTKKIMIMIMITIITE